VPTVYNGIGTWNYGKQRIHSIRDHCESCGHLGTLESFDTTLYFVVLFIPLIPLGKQRVLRQCAKCRKYRHLPLKKWEEIKAADATEVLDNLRQNPDDRDAIVRAIVHATAYQDEPLLDRVVSTLASDKVDDAVVQAQVGDSYGFFSRWPDAEQAYRNSLRVEDNPTVREQLGLALLHQHQPEAARPCLQHIIDEKKIDNAGMIYGLVTEFQAHGQHDEALELMDQRDAAFPDYANVKEYVQQRKQSTRYRGTEKRIASNLFGQKQAGYREGGWKSKAPKYVGILLVLGLLALYLGTAFYRGQNRKVYLINGTNQPYSVTVQGQQHKLAANSSTPIDVEEGDVPVAFVDAKPGLDPQTFKIETPFWGRPFDSPIFVINPDRWAVVVEEEATYAKANPPEPSAATIHFGKPFYALPDVDYEFEPFPQSIKVKGNSTVRKTRVGVEPNTSPETRLTLIQDHVEPDKQAAFAKQLLTIDPSQTLILYWLMVAMSPEESIAFLEPRLEEKPILMEWHRVYGSQMEKAHPEIDLRPRYRKLLAENPDNSDAMYLLGRTDPDLDESEKLYRRASTAKVPSGHAFSGLGFRAMSEGRFAEACAHLEKAVTLLRDKSIVSRYYEEALLANRDFDRLMQQFQRNAASEGQAMAANVQLIRLAAIRGQKPLIQTQTNELLQKCRQSERDTIRRTLNAIVCCAEEDAAGFLRNNQTPTFESAFLGGDLSKAAAAVEPGDPQAATRHGLLYLKATKAGNKAIADTAWTALLEGLNKGSREDRRFAELLTGKLPNDSGLANKLPIDPSTKRVLLAVLAQRQPAQAAELLKLARQLNFQRDVTGLCFRDVVK